MNTMKKGLAVLIGATAIVGGTELVQADTLYREVFPAAVGAGTKDINVGWHDYYSNSSNSGKVSELTNGIGLSTTGSVPNNLPGVNCVQFDPMNTGRFILSSTTTLHALEWTDEYTFNTASYTNLTVSWYQQSMNAGIGARLAMKTGGQWYVSDAVSESIWDHTLYYPVTSQFGLKTVDVATTNWYTLTAEIGKPFAIGTTAGVLPSGLVTAFGIYYDNNGNGGSAFDTFQINGDLIPEPASLGLLAIGIGTMAIRRRK